MISQDVRALSHPESALSHLERILSDPVPVPERIPDPDPERAICRSDKAHLGLSVPSLGLKGQDRIPNKVYSEGKSDSLRDVTQGNPLWPSEEGFKIEYFHNIYGDLYPFQIYPVLFFSQRDV